MFEIIICLSLCKHRRGLYHQGKDEIVKESEKGMLNDELYFTPHKNVQCFYRRIEI